MTFKLMQLFQQQYRTFGSFGRDIRDGRGMLPVIDTEAELADFERALARIEGRHVFR
jgi:alcohol dehydrogenase